MKTSLLFSFLLTLIFAFSIEAKFTPAERDVKNYEAATNVEKNIKFHGERELDVYYDKECLRKKKDVVIHIFGSSFIFGDKIGQTRIGSLLEEEGYVAVVPNYVLYPDGDVEDMVDDIYTAIQWTYKNISKYGGNPKKISICAHSAGADIVALTIVKSTLGITNDGKVLKSLPKLEKVILLNGPYVFDQEFLAYILQGNTEDTSNTAITSDPDLQVLLQQLIVKYNGDDSISPVALLKKQDNGSVKFDVEKFVFFYTSEDNVIPESSSKYLISEISRTSKNSFEYIYEEGLGHATVTDGVRADDEYYREKYMKLIEA